MGEMFLGDVIVLVYLVFRNKWFVLGIVILDNEIKGVLCMNEYIDIWVILLKYLYIL